MAAAGNQTVTLKAQYGNVNHRASALLRKGCVALGLKSAHTRARDAEVSDSHRASSADTPGSSRASAPAAQTSIAATPASEASASGDAGAYSASDTLCQAPAASPNEHTSEGSRAASHVPPEGSSLPEDLPAAAATPDTKRSYLSVATEGLTPDGNQPLWNSNSRNVSPLNASRFTRVTLSSRSPPTTVDASPRVSPPSTSTASASPRVSPPPTVRLEKGAHNDASIGVQGGAQTRTLQENELSDDERKLLKLWRQARSEREWAIADAFRAELRAKGIEPDMIN